MLQMAVLDFDAVVMLNHKAIPTLSRECGFLAFGRHDQTVRFSVSRSQDLAARHCEDLHTSCDILHGEDTQVRPVMSIISGRTAEWIECAWARIHVGILLDKAIFTKSASDGKVQIKARRGD
ncbi:hypothetical protein ASD31_00105 [Rhizobium sp. Root482]|nr:hypothetical protein ASD31_00105 [Rhizobium sp. Root482]